MTTPVILGTAAGDSVRYYYAPVWSPNESRIAYLEVVRGTDFAPRRTRVWTANANGTSPSLLATLDAATGRNGLSWVR